MIDESSPQFLGLFSNRVERSEGIWSRIQVAIRNKDFITARGISASRKRRGGYWARDRKIRAKGVPATSKKAGHRSNQYKKGDSAHNGNISEMETVSSLVRVYLSAKGSEKKHHRLMLACFCKETGRDLHDTINLYR